LPRRNLGFVYSMDPGSRQPTGCLVRGYGKSGLRQLVGGLWRVGQQQPNLGFLYSMDPGSPSAQASVVRGYVFGHMKVKAVRVPGQAGHVDPREPGPMPRPNSTVRFAAPSSAILDCQLRALFITTKFRGIAQHGPRISAASCRLVRGYGKGGLWPVVSGPQ